MKNLKISDFQMKLNKSQLIDKFSKKNIKGGNNDKKDIPPAES